MKSVPVQRVVQGTTQIQGADGWQTSCLRRKWSTVAGTSVGPTLAPELVTAVIRWTSERKRKPQSKDTRSIYTENSSSTLSC